MTRVEKEVNELGGAVNFEGGLGVGGEPLLGRRAGSPKPICLQPSEREVGTNEPAGIHRSSFGEDQGGHLGSFVRVPT